MHLQREFKKHPDTNQVVEWSGYGIVRTINLFDVQQLYLEKSLDYQGQVRKSRIYNFMNFVLAMIWNRKRKKNQRYDCWDNTYQGKHWIGLQSYVRDDRRRGLIRPSVSESISVLLYINPIIYYLFWRQNIWMLLIKQE